MSSSLSQGSYKHPLVATNYSAILSLCAVTQISTFYTTKIKFEHTLPGTNIMLLLIYFCLRVTGTSHLRQCITYFVLHKGWYCNEPFAALNEDCLPGMFYCEAGLHRHKSCYILHKVPSRHNHLLKEKKTKNHDTE